MNMDLDKNEAQIDHIFCNIKELVVNSRNRLYSTVLKCLVYIGI